MQEVTDKQLQAAEWEYYPHDDNHARDMRTAFENGARWAMAQQTDRAEPSTREAAFTDIRCTLCGARRLSSGVCSLIGCKNPVYDLEMERNGAKWVEPSAEVWKREIARSFCGHGEDKGSAVAEAIASRVAAYKAPYKPDPIEEHKAENEQQQEEDMQAAPGPIGDMIERMKAAHLKAVHAHNMTRTDGGFNGETCFHLGLTAAYKVAIEGMVSLDAVMVAIAKEWTAQTMEFMLCSEFQARIRARLEAKPKTAEERVVIEESERIGDYILWRVMKDGRKVGPLFACKGGREAAEIFRLGVIAQLKDNSNA